jgi:hypothetical protein
MLYGVTSLAQPYQVGTKNKSPWIFIQGLRSFRRNNYDDSPKLPVTALRPVCFEEIVEVFMSLTLQHDFAVCQILLFPGVSYHTEIRQLGVPGGIRTHTISHYSGERLYQFDHKDMQRGAPCPVLRPVALLTLS